MHLYRIDKRRFDKIHHRAVHQAIDQVADTARNDQRRTDIEQREAAERGRKVARY